MQIKDMHADERPREKALFHGIDTLSNVELLAIILKTGTKSASSLDLANEIIQCCGGFSHLQELSLADLVKIKGIKQTKALEVLAAIELSSRLQLSERRNQRHINNAEDVFEYLVGKLQDQQQECLVTLFLNTKNMIIRERVIYKGGLDSSVAHPREIYKEAMACSAARIIIAHNHPSGNVTPSKADIELTRMIASTGNVVGIPLLDHLIIGKNRYISLREAELF